MLTGEERDGSERGGKVMAGYRRAYGQPDREVLRVVLFDLLRYAAVNGVDFEAALDRARKEVAANLT